MEKFLVKDLSKKNLVTQSNALVESRYFMSKNEQLIICAMISFIDPKDEDFLTYRTSVSQFAELLGIDKKSSNREMKVIIERLLTRVIQLDTIHGWKMFQWLSYAEADTRNDSLFLRFHDQLKPYLLELKSQFTSFKLDEVVHLKSVYSIRIYQLVKDYIGRKQKIFTYYLIDFRSIVLGKNSKKYPVFKDFRVNILDKSKKELDEKSPLTFTYKTIRVGRSIGKIEFTIVRQNLKNQEAITVSGRTIKTEPIKPKNSLMQAPEFQKMCDIGINPKQAIDLIKEHKPEYIQEKLLVLEYKQKVEPVGNPAGFFVMAVNGDWQSEELIAQLRADRLLVEKQKREAEARKKQEIEDERIKLEKSYSLIARNQYLSIIGASEKKKLRQEFSRIIGAIMIQAMGGTRISDDKFLIHSAVAFYVTQYIPNYEKEKNEYISTILNNRFK
jgi:plasmid replication initiation protein